MIKYNVKLKLGEKFPDICLGNNFTDIIPKEQTTKNKNKQWK